MKTAIITATKQGRLTAERIRRGLPEAEIIHHRDGIREAISEAWSGYRAIVCVMAAGIVVRCLAGLCRSKYRDPCVVVVDEAGRHAISLLSGHIGGGNRLAGEVAAICGGTAVITTASDVSGHTALDLWAIEENLCIATPDRLAAVSTRLLDLDTVSVFSGVDLVKSLPADFRSCAKRGEADIVIALEQRPEDRGLVLIPRNRYIGFGCRRGTTVAEFEAALEDLVSQSGLDLRSIGGAASIDLKRDEAGLLEICERRCWPLRFFSRARIASVEVPSASAVVRSKIGVSGVCEAAALLAAATGTDGARLIIEKRKWERVTVAVAETTY